MENKNKLLAKIGNIEIFESEVDYMLQNLNPQVAMNFKGEEGKNTLLNELINQKLLYSEALEQGLDKDAEFIEELDKLKENYLTQFAVKKIINSVSVTDDELKNFYEKNKNMFVSKEQITASHILCDSLEEIEKISEEIKSGISFEEAASKYSSCPSSSNGGNLGTFGKGQMVPEFEEAAFSLEKNAISHPVATQFGYHLIKLIEKEEPKQLNFDEVKSQIHQNLLAEKQHKNYMDNIELLRNKYTIEMM
ncbi:MAG: peptidylprolyl isomerase [Filifactoraceae bacterium]